MKTKIFLIRHGQSLGNAEHLILGHTDRDLSPLGYEQARATADYLASEHIDAIYSSDLMRAKNTAVPHAQRRGMEVITSVGLREMYVGEWENKSVATVKEEYGDMYDVDWTLGFGTFVMPGGESTQEAGRRFYNELERIARAEVGKTVLVAAHAAVIRAFWAIADNIAPEDVASRLPFPTNASYSVVEYENGKFIPVEYSHDEHLSSVGITGIAGVGK